jgi:hypothetical protein
MSGEVVSGLKEPDNEVSQFRKFCGWVERALAIERLSVDQPERGTLWIEREHAPDRVVKSGANEISVVRLEVGTRFDRYRTKIGEEPEWRIITGPDCIERIK